MQQEPHWFIPRLDKAENLLRDHKPEQAFCAYWDALRYNPWSSKAYRGLALAYSDMNYNPESPVHTPVTVTANYNYMSFMLNPEDPTPLMDNALLHLLDENHSAAKFWYDMWADRSDEDPIPIDELCMIKQFQLFDSMDDQKEVNDIFWKIYMRYPEYVDLYVDLKEEVRKEIKYRRPRWVVTAEEIKMMNRRKKLIEKYWIIPQSPSYTYWFEEGVDMI